MIDLIILLLEGTTESEQETEPTFVLFRLTYTPWAIKRATLFSIIINTNK